MTAALTTQDVIDSRPEIDPDRPFADIIGHLAAAVTSTLEIVAIAEADDFQSRFDAFTADEQTRFGATVAAGLVALTAARVEIAGRVGDAFGAEL